MNPLKELFILLLHNSSLKTRKNSNINVIDFTDCLTR